MNIENLLGYPTSVKLSKVIPENEIASTLLFENARAGNTPHPGQFIMIWVPGVDEIPMSVSIMNDSHLGFTVVPVGQATETLVTLKKGDWIGVRGPFGSGFTITSGKTLIIGGGSGMASLRPLIYELSRNNADVTVIIASRTMNSLLFYDELSSIKDIEVVVATDDGSMGHKGLATDIAEKILEVQDFDMIYTCGPELMMKRVHELANNHSIRMEASLERFMKCGCGICGSCAMDPTGELVCISGPVFSGEQLDTLDEFGAYYRNSMGVKKYLE